MPVDRVRPGLPVLGRGKHRAPEDGACLMEYVSILAGEGFSDRPRCTAPGLAELARRVNDEVDDETRAGLVLLAPDLVDAGATAAADDVVVLCCTDGGLALAPDQSSLLRLRARARWRLRHRWAGRVVRLPGHGAVGEAYLAAASAMRALPRAERDVRVVAVLHAALRAVRAARPLTDAAPTAHPGATEPSRTPDGGR